MCIRDSPITHPAKAPYNLFAQASDSVKSGIVIGLGTRLQTLQSKEVERLISTSDISLTLPGKEKCAYFIILSDQGPHLQFLSSLFFSLLFQDLVIFADVYKRQLQPLAMLIVLDFVWDCIKEDCTQRKAVIIDELWQLIGSTATKQSSDFVVDIYRLIRAYSGAAISASQDVYKRQWIR